MSDCSGRNGGIGWHLMGGAVPADALATPLTHFDLPAAASVQGTAQLRPADACPTQLMGPQVHPISSFRSHSPRQC